MQAVNIFQNLSPWISGLPAAREIFEQSPTTSSSNMSTISSISDDESPMFRRTQKITFVDMKTVASSSVRYLLIWIYSKKGADWIYQIL